jgi:hypothetical protein
MDEDVDGTVAVAEIQVKSSQKSFIIPKAWNIHFVTGE